MEEHRWTTPLDDRPLVHVCLRHWRSYIPFFGRRFHIHFSKPIADFTLADSTLVAEMGARRGWKVEVWRDAWPDERT